VIAFLNNRAPRRRAALLRGCLALFLLVCFAGLQTASVAHWDDDAGCSHDHCCPVCHAGHLPVLVVAIGVVLAPPAVLNCPRTRDVAGITVSHAAVLRPPRAPPVQPVL
jgi:hypothetical protein